MQTEETPSTVLSAIENEANLYCGPLRPLQGRVLPEFYGLWKSRMEDENHRQHDVYLVMMEEVGLPTADSTEAEEAHIPLLLHLF